MQPPNGRFFHRGPWISKALRLNLDLGGRRCLHTKYVQSTCVCLSPVVCRASHGSGLHITGFPTRLHRSLRRLCLYRHICSKRLLVSRRLPAAPCIARWNEGGERTIEHLRSGWSHRCQCWTKYSSTVSQS